MSIASVARAHDYRLSQRRRLCASALSFSLHLCCAPSRTNYRRKGNNCAVVRHLRSSSVWRLLHLWPRSSMIRRRMWDVPFPQVSSFCPLQLVWDATEPSYLAPLIRMSLWATFWQTILLPIRQMCWRQQPNLHALSLLFHFDIFIFSDLFLHTSYCFHSCHPFLPIYNLP